MSNSFFILPASTPYTLHPTPHTQLQNCHSKTTKVLKFPKIFGHSRKKQYLCTLFVVWHGASPAEDMQHLVATLAANYGTVTD